MLMLYDPYFAAVPGEDAKIYPHTANGLDRLSAEDVAAYLTASGYADETETLTAQAQQHPCTYTYTKDRHRYVVYQMPGGYWQAGDCTETEEQIKASRTRHGSGYRY